MASVYTEKEKILVQGAVTIDDVVVITQRGMALLNEHHHIVDLAQVTEVDSSAISMLFEWLRAARKKDLHVQFINLPANLESLIQLYGAAELITTPKDPTSDQAAV
ncbi:MAG: STAS domain-containing protein [Nitrosomonas sp. PRO4]|nr:STAS domain-containing protein [Nitrosomonas sp. PRO4]